MAQVDLQTSPVPVEDIDASGTPSSSTFLRGDGSWVTASGGGGGGVELIDSQVLESAAGSVVFSAIPDTFEDLQVRMVARCSDSATQLVRLRLNADSGSNYGWTRHYGHTTTGDVAGTTHVGDYAGASEIIVASIPGTGTASGQPVQSVIDILGYTGTTFRKLARSGGAVRIDTQMREERFTGIWENTAAVTTVTLLPSAGNFIIGSRFHLYGIG